MHIRKFVYGPCAVAFAVALGTAALTEQAEAASGNVVIPIFASKAQGNALVTPSSILLSKTGVSTVFFNFVLPADYENGKRIDMNVYLGSQGLPCNAVIKRNSLIRFRKNTDLYSSLGGFTPADGLETASMPGAGYMLVNKQFKLKKTDGYPGQKARDIFSLSIKRDADDLADTCDDVSLFGVSFDYPIDSPN